MGWTFLMPSPMPPRWEDEPTKFQQAPLYNNTNHVLALFANLQQHLNRSYECSSDCGTDCVCSNRNPVRSRLRGPASKQYCFIWCWIRDCTTNYVYSNESQVKSRACFRIAKRECTKHCHYERKWRLGGGWRRKGGGCWLVLSIGNINKQACLRFDVDKLPDYAFNCQQQLLLLFEPNSYPCAEISRRRLLERFESRREIIQNNEMLSY